MINGYDDCDYDDGWDCEYTGEPLTKKQVFAICSFIIILIISWVVIATHDKNTIKQEMASKKVVAHYTSQELYDVAKKQAIKFESLHGEKIEIKGVITYQDTREKIIYIEPCIKAKYNKEMIADLCEYATGDEIKIEVICGNKTVEWIDGEVIYVNMQEVLK